ncbi:signal peptidase II [Pseudoalteromonas luteoviolacea]|nr:signal peptidase II [Pseudoalteromonas luteoviolacea]MBE0387757.1 signal peptidase II [Pseudoalteromonas luteoviolacea DSM 6061]
MTENKGVHIALVCAICLILDQGTKWWASDYLVPWQMTSYWGDIVRIGYTENLGVFLSFGADFTPLQRTLFFVIAIGVFLSALMGYMLKSHDLTKLQVTSLSLIFAGGLGNLIDRVLNQGAVIDFINVGVGSLRTGIFNIADVAIMIGAVIIILATPMNAQKSAT